MTHIRSYRWAGAVVAAAGFIAAAVAAPPDPIDVAKARQQIADQKAQAEVLDTIKTADLFARTNPAKAAQLLRAAQTNIDLAAGISGGTRKQLTTLLNAKIVALGGRPLPLPLPGPRNDPKTAELKAAQKDAVERYAAEMKEVREGVDLIQKHQLAGQLNSANAEIARLTKAYPNNPAVIVLGQTDSIKSRVADAQAFAKLQNERMFAVQKGIMESSLPAVRDVEFPKDWKEKTARRLKTVELSDKEKKIIEALDKPVSVSFADRPLEEALQDLSNKLDQPLLIDKRSLEDFGVDLKRGATLDAKGLSGRTVLRSILATQGLTFVVKDEAIQILTVERAKSLLTTRVYYLGDLVQGVGPFGGIQWGPFLNMQQTLANAQVLADTITKSIDPLSWKEAGGPGTVTFHVPSMSLIVRASSEVHHTLGRSFGAGR